MSGIVKYYIGVTSMVIGLIGSLYCIYGVYTFIGIANLLPFLNVTYNGLIIELSLMAAFIMIFYVGLRLMRENRYPNSALR
jgi:hypothetical protein